MKSTLALVLDFVARGDRSMEVFLLGLSEKMISDGWNLVHVYTGEPGQHVHNRLKELNIPYIISPKSLNLKSARKLGAEIKKYSPNVMLTAFYSTFDPAIWQLRWSSGVKHWIVNDHSSGFVREKKGLARFVAKLRGTMVSRMFDKVITCSDFVRNRDIDRVYFPEAKVQTVHNGIDVSRFIPLSKKEKGQITIAYAGQLIPEKGVAILLKAVSGLKVQPKLLIAGTGHQSAELELLATNLGLKPEWLGRIDWVPRLFAEADIAVFPSTWAEAFGFVVAEAMACETCVVVSNVGGIPEVVGEDGIIVPAGDVNALQEALVKLIDDPLLRRSLGEAGRRRVLEKFTIEKMIEGYAAVIKEVVR
jgi:glycosyltransferase involved in cell wall biosynthesis